MRSFIAVSVLALCAVASVSAGASSTIPTVTLTNNGQSSNSFNWNGNVRFDDPDVGGDFSLQVNYGDGAPLQYIAPITRNTDIPLTHTYSQPGDYLVVVDLSDGEYIAQRSTIADINTYPPSITVAAASNDAQGMSFTFNYGIGNRRPAESYTLTVNYGDGQATQSYASTADGALAYTYRTPGTHVVTVVATDKYGAANTATTTGITVSNVAPNPTVTVAATGLIGDAYSMVFQFSDPGSAQQTYTALVNYGDGDIDEYSGLAVDTLYDIAHTYTRVGTFSVSVSVFDSAAQSNVGTLTRVADVRNQPPTPITIVNSPSVINEGQSISAYYTYVPRGENTYTAFVNYGDATGAEQTIGDSSLIHTYAKSGVYTVSVVLTDQLGLRATGSSPITVNNINPTVTFSSSGSVFVGTEWFGTFSFTDPGSPSNGGSEVYTALVTYGDSQSAVLTSLPTTSSNTVRHSYNSPGSYTVMLQVFDGESLGVNTGNIQTVTAVINNVNPIVRITPSSATSLSQGSVWSGSYAIDNRRAMETYTVVVNYDDQTATMTLSQSVGTFAHTYRRVGVHQLTLTVTDQFGAVGSAVQQVSIANVQPTVTIQSSTPTQVLVNTQWNGAYLFTDPGSAAGEVTETYTAIVNYGDGSFQTQSAVTTSTVSAFQHTYRSIGTFTTVITVTDSNGATGTQAVNIRIRGALPQVVLSGPSALNQGVQWQGSYVITNREAEPYTITVNYDDQTGVFPVSDAVSSLSHTYYRIGQRQILLTAVDAFGQVGTATQLVAVANVVPSVTITPTSQTVLNIGQNFVGTFSFTDPGFSVESYTVLINYGDGQTNSIQTINPVANGQAYPLNHQYTAPGRRDLTVTVTDSNNGVNVATLSLVNIRIATRDECVFNRAFLPFGATSPGQCTITPVGTKCDIQCVPGVGGSIPVPPLGYSCLRDYTRTAAPLGYIGQQQCISSCRLAANRVPSNANVGECANVALGSQCNIECKNPNQVLSGQGFYCSEFDGIIRGSQTCVAASCSLQSVRAVVAADSTGRTTLGSCVSTSLGVQAACSLACKNGARLESTQGAGYVCAANGVLTGSQRCV